MGVSSQVQEVHGWVRNVTATRTGLTSNPVGSESITTGQCILVKHDEGEEQGIDPSRQWKAKVLEVRALDTEHVYIRVAWLNRPEDLTTGRKSYHGKYELVPTNQMDIIDAMSVNGPCDVVQWDEQDDESPALPEVSNTLPGIQVDMQANARLGSILLATDL